MTTRSRLSLIALAAAVGSAATLAAVTSAPAETTTGATPQTMVGRVAKPRAGLLATDHLIETRVIGKSVEGRPITAHLVGDPTATRTQMVLGNMHGDEPRTDDTAYAIIKGPRVRGIKIWVIPTMNPDGLARGSRTNARGVDLNHNFDDHWYRNSPGRYYSGPSPLSEPESKAVFAFVSQVKPQYLVSLHQPWAAVDDERVKSTVLQQALSTNLGLPIKWTGKNPTVSSGTLVGHVNAAVTPTAAITVEYSASPSKEYTDVTARNGLVKALGGHY